MRSLLHLLWSQRCSIYSDCASSYTVFDTSSIWEKQSELMNCWLPINPQNVKLSAWFQWENCVGQLNHETNEGFYNSHILAILFPQLGAIFCVHTKYTHRFLSLYSPTGVQFIWDSCCESVKKANSSSGSGCILAHCMGLGKTLQVETHTFAPSILVCLHLS